MFPQLGVRVTEAAQQACAGRPFDRVETDKEVPAGQRILVWRGDGGKNRKRIWKWKRLFRGEFVEVRRLQPDLR